MPSELAERKAARVGAPLPPAAEQDPLPCPRCDSTNTKFCYYNNYNFSQPRHFCKSCRRYWTHGGTLRDIPVGGGSRKSAKRSRTSSSSYTSSSLSSAGPAGSQPPLLEPIPATPVFVSLSSSSSNAVSAAGGTAASFTSLLNSAGPAGILPPLGGFGLGLGFEDVGGFGLGRSVWALPDHQVGYVSGNVINGGGASGESGGAGGSGGGCNGGGVSRGDTWRVESDDQSDFGPGGDCFASLPELAISTPGNGLK